MTKSQIIKEIYLIILVFNCYSFLSQDLILRNLILKDLNNDTILIDTIVDYEYFNDPNIYNKLGKDSLLIYWGANKIELNTDKMLVKNITSRTNIDSITEKLPDGLYKYILFNLDSLNYIKYEFTITNNNINGYYIDTYIDHRELYIPSIDSFAYILFTESNDTVHYINNKKNGFRISNSKYPDFFKFPLYKLENYYVYYIEDEMIFSFSNSHTNNDNHVEFIEINFDLDGRTYNVKK